MPRKTTKIIKAESTQITSSIKAEVIGLALRAKEVLGKPESTSFLVEVEGYLDAIQATRDILAASLKKHTIESGTTTSDAGSKSLVLGGYEIPLVARGADTFDPKKVEALLRAQNIKPEKYMDMNISFSLNLEKMAPLLQDPEWKQALDSCKKEISYALMPLKKVAVDED